LRSDLAIRPAQHSANTRSGNRYRLPGIGVPNPAFSCIGIGQIYIGP
jgi:hypothetical protein